VRYRARGREVRSEDAAQASTHRARFLQRWIEQHPHVKQALDYGCGKLRYSPVLAGRCDHLTLVDSEVQIQRLQPIVGRRTTIPEWVAANLPRTRVLTADQFQQDGTNYDLVLCSNVLSAIPSYSTRRHIVTGIRDHLRGTGHSLFVTQYRHSYFTRMRRSDRAIQYLDGWLVESTRGTHFYGVIDRESLVRLVRSCKLDIEASWTNDKSAYVLARHRQ